LTLDKLAFDPSNIRTHGLVFTTLSRVKTMNSLFLIQKITQENFCINQKVTTKMKRLLENQSWKLDYVQSSIKCFDRISIVTLNMRSLHAHLDDILQDDDLNSTMIICLQETRTSWLPNKKQFSKFNFNATYYVHGVISCIERNIDIIATKKFYSNIVELVMSEVYVQ